MDDEGGQDCDVEEDPHYRVDQSCDQFCSGNGNQIQDRSYVFDSFTLIERSVVR
jgi:hypothetical protein